MSKSIKASKTAKVAKSRKAYEVAKIPKSGKGAADTITVTITPGVGDRPSFEYSPDIFSKRKGSSSLSLLLSDPEDIGYRFTDFRWLTQGVKDDYILGKTVRKKRIDVTLDNQFEAQTDLRYEVLVETKAKGKKPVPKRTVAISQPTTLANGSIFVELDAIMADAADIATRAFDISMQLRSGPVIRNEPR